jgi:putative membrane protein
MFPCDDCLCVIDRNRHQLSISGLRFDPHRLGSGAVRIEVAQREILGSLRVNMDNELLGTVLDCEALDLTESVAPLYVNDESLNPLSRFVAVGVRTPCRRRHDDKRDQHRMHLSKVTDRRRRNGAEKAHLADPKRRAHGDKDWAHPSRLLVVAVTLFLLGPSHAFAQSGDPEVGRDVFQANCAMCHGVDASGMMGMHPSLRGAVERLTVEGVEVTIRNGRDTMPPMPAFEGRLTDQEINGVVAYLDTLPVGPRNFGAEGDGMMNMDGMMDGMWWWLAWVVLFLVVVAVIVIASILVTRSLLKRGEGVLSSRRDAALDILKERYARGEIDRDEYEERRTTLQG